LITQVNALNILGKYSHLWSNKLFGGIKAFPVDWFIVSLGKHYVNFRIIIYVILCSTLQFIFFFFFLMGSSKKIEFRYVYKFYKDIFLLLVLSQCPRRVVFGVDVANVVHIITTETVFYYLSFQICVFMWKPVENFA